MSAIVVPLDRSELGERALRVAGLVARHTDRELVLVAVSTATSAERDDRRLQEVAAGQEAATTTVLVPRQEVPSVADGIARAVADAGPDPLVCIASHGRGAIGAGLLGSTTEDLVAVQAAPVLVVGPACADSWPQQRRLLVPLDGTEACEDILPAAAGLATDWGLDTWLVQVVQARPVPSGEQADEGLCRARRRLVDLGVEPKGETRFGSDVGGEICREASDIGAAVVVMATAEHPGLHRVLVGSVTMDVVRQAPCPVLVLPTPAL